MKLMAKIGVAAGCSFALGACGNEAVNPPTEPAAPIVEAAADNPTAPVRPGDGPDSFVGLWAANAAWCANTSSMTDQVPVRISTEQFQGYENSCDITAIEQSGDGYEAVLACEAEGMSSQERVNMRVREDRLTLTYLDRGTEPVQLVRCETPNVDQE